MRAGRIIAFITAAIFIILAFLFILGAFSPEGSPSWIIVGIIGLVIGFVLIFVGFITLWSSGLISCGFDFFSLRGTSTAF